MPPRSGVRITHVQNQLHMSNIVGEVQKLLEKGAIEPVPHGQEGKGFYSTFFTMPKKDGGTNDISPGLTSLVHLEILEAFLQKALATERTMTDEEPVEQSELEHNLPA